MFTGIYGPTKDSLRDQCWLELHDCHSVSDFPWCIMGDFNAIASATEQSSLKGPIGGTRGFRDWISDSGVIEIPLSNKKFTWSNLRDAPTLSKIDRYFVDLSWKDFFPLARLEGLSRIV
ncbi:hypothetical protein QJS04_geneDACA001222 [Acorus gramineus]|uniref:Endonuclease/exonuclease/phosphatase domain-containing protein n=1 Tax=Acorus gramineus TaxID=55184 RepID=A0AAV9AER4_ACOGR|nr:hypothetical protein QJS04_geneDACA001222 [Acorus gramineus]